MPSSVWLVAKEFLSSFIAIQARRNRNYHILCLQNAVLENLKDLKSDDGTCKIVLDDEDFPKFLGGQQHCL